MLFLFLYSIVLLSEFARSSAMRKSLVRFMVFVGRRDSPEFVVLEKSNESFYLKYTSLARSTGEQPVPF